MNRLDQLLRNEMSRYLERIAGTSPVQTLPFITVTDARLRERLEQTEERLAAVRAELLERYAAWEAGLKEMENLWALAALKRNEAGAAELQKSAA